MIYPPFAEVKRLAKNFSSIPLCKTIFADTETPVSLYDRLRDRPYSFLLESVEGGEKWARYSFIGADPFLIVTCREGQVTLSGKEGTKRFAADPFDVVQDLLLRYRTPGYSGHPPFWAERWGTSPMRRSDTWKPCLPFSTSGKGPGPGIST